MEVYNNVCNSYLFKSTYLRDSPKVKASAENIGGGAYEARRL